MAAKRVMDDAAQRLFRQTMDAIPHGSLAKHASEQERFLVVSQALTALWPLLGDEARAARRPASMAGLAKGQTRATSAPGRRRPRVPAGKGRWSPSSGSRALERRLQSWLPPGITTLAQAKAWLQGVVD